MIYKVARTVTKYSLRAFQQSRNLTSKHLFNVKPKGVYDEDVGPIQAAFKKVLMAQDDWGVENPPEVHAAKLRKWMDTYFAKLCQHPNYVKAVDNCEHTEFLVPIRDGNDSEVRVLVHTPKNLKDNKNNVAMLYAHGGAVIAGSADLYKPALSLLAQDCGMVVFNVDYRLAPETKCPKNILDFYCSLKHIIENADNLGIDSTKVGISGESGGGYICFGTMVMLAQRDESNLVKAALPIVPMVSDYFFSDSRAMTDEESYNACGMRSAWKAIAEDLESQWSSPLLFPDKSSDSLLKKMPPTIMFSAEFDMFITETERLAHRMRRAGTLLEFCCMPGVGHGSYFNAYLECHSRFHKYYKQAVDEYIK